ncbi:hypothetical protein B4U79_05735, partial [Dinothrombium tinctorium]
ILSLVASGVQINRFVIPKYFDLSTNRDLLLDCDYIYNANDIKLVVRWFHNAIPEPIYQWIPEKRIRHVAEQFKQSFDMNYVSDATDPYTKFRAVRIRNPQPSMSGTYTCDISSLAGQSTHASSVYIYASPKSFDFYSKFNEERGDLQLECIAKDVYPLPVLTLSKHVHHISPTTDRTEKVTESSVTDNDETIIVSSQNESASIEMNANTSLYKISVKHIINRDDLLRTSTMRSQLVFECDLQIPNTNYRKRKRITLYS